LTLDPVQIGRKRQRVTKMYKINSISISLKLSEYFEGATGIDLYRMKTEHTEIIRYDPEVHHAGFIKSEKNGHKVSATLFSKGADGGSPTVILVGCKTEQEVVEEIKRICDLIKDYVVVNKK